MGIREAFEVRRKAIMTECRKEGKYERDEYSEYDFKALDCLLRTILELLQYVPEDRPPAQLAASYIDWSDYRHST